MVSTKSKAPHRLESIPLASPSLQMTRGILTHRQKRNSSRWKSSSTSQLWSQSSNQSPRPRITTLGQTRWAQPHRKQSYQTLLPKEWASCSTAKTPWRCTRIAFSMLAMMSSLRKGQRESRRNRNCSKLGHSTGVRMSLSLLTPSIVICQRKTSQLIAKSTRRYPSSSLHVEHPFESLAIRAEMFN